MYTYFRMYCLFPETIVSTVFISTFYREDCFRICVNKCSSGVNCLGKALASLSLSLSLSIYIYIYIYIYMYVYIYLKECTQCVCVCVCICIHERISNRTLIYFQYCCYFSFLSPPSYIYIYIYVRGYYRNTSYI